MKNVSFVLGDSPPPRKDKTGLIALGAPMDIVIPARSNKLIRLIGMTADRALLLVPPTVSTHIDDGREVIAAHQPIIFRLMNDSNDDLVLARGDTIVRVYVLDNGDEIEIRTKV